MPTRKKNAVIADMCSQRLKALTDHMATKGEIAVEGGRYTRAQLIAIFQASLDTRSALVKSRAQVKVDLGARSKAEADRLAIEPGLQAWVVGQFGASSNEAFEFGYTKKKPSAPSAATRANAVKLAQATRVARGTKGPKEKVLTSFDEHLLPRDFAEFVELRAVA